MDWMGRLGRIGRRAPGRPTWRGLLPAALAFALLAGTALPQTNPAPLVIEEIEFTGNHRTPSEVALRHLPLEPGQPADPDSILAATEALKESRLFRKVEVHTEPGSAPGKLKLVYSVEEPRVHVRFGAGYEDISGWYLIPIQLNMDNLTGHGEALDLSAKFGYRLDAVTLNLRYPGLRSDTPYWNLQLRNETLDRLFYQDRTELNQETSRTGAGFKVVRPLRRHLSLASWLSIETVAADSFAVVEGEPRFSDLDMGDRVSFGDLPSGIQSGIARRTQTRLGAAMEWDSRSGPGLETRGLWAYTSLEGVLSSEGHFLSSHVDLRGYAPVARGLQLAGRGRFTGATENAPFYERPYIGGLYTVRGFPNQSLSPPDGDLAIATASVELRSSWIGPPQNPLLVGILFADAAVGWDDRPPDLDEGALGVGWGLRVRIPWIQYIGIDVGYPLTDGPVRESFHVSGLLGWTF